MILNKRSLLLALMLAAVVCMPLFASVTGGTFGLRTARTEHFDIIYEKGNEQTASVLYDSCERLYESLVQYYGKDPNLHLPVVLTSRFKVLNAYYTNYTANHIVLFDTVGPVGNLSNYPQTLEYVFLHELTHAFQFNLRGKGLQVISNIFGDVVTLSPLLFMYPSMSEGGAVLSESRDGYGRLNDSYAMQIVRQAKIEGLFPQWIDIAGSRDTYPSGLIYYNFAAAFLQYLSITYGYDTIADLYVNFGQPGWFDTVAKIFKSHLGISVEQAWQHFFAWVEVPADVMASKPLAAMDRLGLYSNPVVSDLGNVFVYDNSCWSVLQLTPDLSQCQALVMAPTNDPELSVSEDGLKLILVPEVLEGKTSLQLINADGSKTGRLLHEFSDQKKDIRSGCFVTIDGTKYVLAYSNIGQNTYVDIYDMINYKMVDGKSLSLGYGVIASKFCSIGDSQVSCIISYGSHDYLALLDLSTMTLAVVDNPIDAQLTSLSSGLGPDGRILCFTWYPSGTEDPSLGRYGEFEVSSMTVRLSQTNVSGGMNSALRLGDEILFISHYYEGYDLCSISHSDMEFFLESSLSSSPMFEAPAPDGNALEQASHRYLPLRYIKDGVLIPFGRATYGESSYDFGFGATWVSMDPTETYGLEVSAGSGFNSSVFASVAVNSSALLPTNIYGSYCYYMGDDAHSFETGIDTSASLVLSHVGETLSFREKFDYCFLFHSDGTRDRLVHNYFAADYSNFRSTGLGIYDKKGFSVRASLTGKNPGLSFSVVMPHLLWFACNGPDTYNIPASMTLSADYDVNSGKVDLMGFMDLVLYSHEFQSGIPFFGLYLTREVVDLQYTALFAANDLSFSNTMKLSSLLYMSPVVGEYLTQVQFGLGLSLVTDFADYSSLQIAFGANL